MKKTLLRTIKILVIAAIIALARHFIGKDVPNSNNIIPENHEVVTQQNTGQSPVTPEGDAPIVRPNDETPDPRLNLHWNEMEDDTVYFGKYDGANTEYLLANKERGILHKDSLTEWRKMFDTSDSTIDEFTLLYKLFNFHDSVNHDGYGIFDPCKRDASDPRRDQVTPIFKTNCDFVYLRYVNQPVIHEAVPSVDNENSSTTLKRYNRYTETLETIDTLNMLFVLSDVQDEYLIGTRHLCLNCDGGQYDTIRFNTLTKEVTTYDIETPTAF